MYAMAVRHLAADRLPLPLLTSSARPQTTCLLQWWGACLDSKPEGETDGEGRQVYVLK